MKLFFCKKCKDVVNLSPEERKCDCGASKGQYIDQLQATISGPAVPIGINNASFLAAIQKQPQNGEGSEFIAFVIPKGCSSVVPSA